MRSTSKTILCVAGGSGGHIFPCLSAVRSMRRLSTPPHIAVITTRHPRDQRALASVPDIVRDTSIRLELAPRLSARWWSRLLTFPGLWRMAHRLCADVQPTTIVAFGGWLTAPFALVAKMRGIPIIIHEQNVVPGRANRFLGRFAQTIAASFEETRQLWPAAASRMVVTGNPIRCIDDSITRDVARSHWKVDGSQLIVALGGSSGSHAINAGLPDACAALPEAIRARIYVLHLAGAQESSHVAARYASAGIRARVVPFLDHMALAYRAADLVVSRAGAGTIAELAHFGCPAVLIPYPYARQHQKANAQLMARAGGAVVLEQAGGWRAQLTETLEHYLESPAELDAMRVQMEHLGTSRAADALAQLITGQSADMTQELIAA